MQCFWKKVISVFGELLRDDFPDDSFAKNKGSGQTTQEMRTNDTAHRRIYNLLSCLHKIGILPYTMIIAFSVAAESCYGALCEESPSAVPIIDATRTTDTTLIIVRSELELFKGTADIFIFDDDERKTLETYQRMELVNGTTTILSTSGSKLIATILNPSGDRYQWAGINTASNILEIEGDLRMDNPEKPLMSAFSTLDSKLDRIIDLEPERLMSEIYINSISCDFSGRAYNGEKLTDAKVYLTNVNARCGVFRGSGFKPTDILNSCSLSENDLSTMVHPQMIYREIKNDIGPDNFKTDISLWCYPNDIENENGGNRFTRLVIEGKIENVTWFYPITINRTSGSTGIGRNCRYCYDIVIHSTGVSDPDTEASSDMVSFECNLLPWDNAGEQTMHF